VPREITLISNTKWYFVLVSSFTVIIMVTFTVKVRGRVRFMVMVPPSDYLGHCTYQK